MTDKVPTPTGETYRDEVGADGCGCPITAEHTANGSEVDGSSWTEHRANCWEIKTESEPTGYAATAAALRRIADALDTLPPVGKPPSGQLYLFPGEGGADAVDAILFAVNGSRGETRPGADGWAHSGWISKPSFSICVRAKVPGPPDDRDVELERLRAELAEFRAWKRSDADPDYGRDVDNGDASAEVPGGVEGGPVAGRAAMVTRYFSFGIGQTDPATGEKLRNKYVTVIAPTAESCREAMLASRFGRDWSMEYIPGRPDTDERIPRWAEHERIVVDPVTTAVPCRYPECECDTAVPCGLGLVAE